MRVWCGAQRWLRRSLSRVLLRRWLRGGFTGSTPVLRLVPRLRPAMRLLRGRDKGSRAASRDRAARRPSTRAGPRVTASKVPRPTTPRLVPVIRRRPIADRPTGSRPMGGRFGRGTEIPATPMAAGLIQALRLRGIWEIGSINTVECRLRTRSDCCAATPVSTGYLQATSSGCCNSCTV